MSICVAEQKKKRGFLFDLRVKGKITFIDLDKCCVINDIAKNPDLFSI